jgi:hypothetical protein
MPYGGSDIGLYVRMATQTGAIKMKREAIQRQERDEDGYWIYLKSGWCDAENPNCHVIVESTKREALAHRAMRCQCNNCLFLGGTQVIIGPCATQPTEDDSGWCPVVDCKIEGPHDHKVEGPAQS